MTADLVAATLAAFDAASHLTDADQAAKAAMIALARKIDAWDQIVEFALDDAAGKPNGARPAVPQNDNVSLSAYLKYADALGLTPLGREKLEQKPEAKGGKLSGLRSVPKPA